MNELQPTETITKLSIYETHIKNNALLKECREMDISLKIDANQYIWVIKFSNNKKIMVEIHKKNKCFYFNFYRLLCNQIKEKVLNVNIPMTSSPEAYRIILKRFERKMNIMEVGATLINT